MKYVLALLALFTVTACASLQNTEDEAPPTEKEYRSTFEETWRAVQQAIISYPLKTNNMDMGQIQTATIRGNTQFKFPPLQTKSASSGQRYSLTINVIKVDKKVTKVSILKDSMLYRDFISDAETKTSDGMEEMVLLYRIGREIDIEKALIKASKKKK